jgi:hypothetical protein
VQQLELGAERALLVAKTTKPLCTAGSFAQGKKHLMTMSIFQTAHNGALGERSDAIIRPHFDSWKIVFEEGSRSSETEASKK